MSTWQYLTRKFSGSDLQSKLNECGALKWELISIVVCEAQGQGLDPPYAPQPGRIAATEYRVVLGAEAGRMDKWEYKTFLVKGPQLEETLKPLGDQGWELICMVAVEGQGQGLGPPYAQQPGFIKATQYRVVLKRKTIG